jgi:uncharacterized protein
MPGPSTVTLRIAVSDQVAVTAKVDVPDPLESDTPALVLAHGANNDLDHPLLAYLAAQLATNADVMVARFNFPYVEKGAKSPDPQKLLETTFGRVYDHLVQELSAPGASVFVGGKSLGGRVAAELVSRSVEGEGVLATGLIVLGYPLHAPGRADRLHLEPLRHVGVPSLFCVGSRDPLCDPDLLRPVLNALVHPGTLFVVEGGDHSLRLSRARGRRPEAGYADVAREIGGFIGAVTGRR